MATRITTNWDGVPLTHRRADIVETRQATRIQAVQIPIGSFRCASVGGVFELASPNTQLKTDKNGKVTVEVKMGWFSVKPPTSWANVTILGEHTLLPNYTGPIVHNVSNRRRAR